MRKPIFSPSGVPYPDRFPDVDLADSDLPLRIEFSKMCPSRDEENEKQVNIEVEALRIYLCAKMGRKHSEILLMTIADASIRRDAKTHLPYLHVHPSVKQRVTIGRELREAIMRHITANPFVGKYCRDRLGKGALEQWQASRASLALMDSLQQNSSTQPSGS